MSVMRLGYIHVRVHDLERARAHYEATLGMEVTAEEEGRLYLKAWDEWDHHSVVLEGGGAGLVKLGYKCSHEDDLAGFESRAYQFGVSVERISKNEVRAIGEGVRLVTPSDHVIELYADAEYVGTRVGTLNPAPWASDVPGVAVPYLDHALVMAEDPGLVERFFMECLGFRASERLVTDMGDGDLLATFMACSDSPHDIAVLKGPNGKLHHFAFAIEDWSALLRATDLLAMSETPIEITPQRHGITRGKTTYFFDPSGNRNEIFAGGYRTFADYPTITWTADHLRRGVFYFDAEPVESFTSAVT